MSSDVKEKSTPAGPLLRYSIALTAVVAATLLRLALQHVCGHELPPFILFYPAVMLVALFGGFWPGILATLFAALIVDYTILEPRGSFAIANAADAIILLIFVGMGVFMCIVADRYRAFQRRIATFRREMALRDGQEKLLQASEAIKRQAEMLRLSFDAIIVWQLGGTIESWNCGAEQLYGYSEGEALGAVTHKLLKTTHTEPWPEIEAELRTRGNWSGELRHVAKDGRELTVSTRHQLIRGVDGVERVLEINRDITEREQMDKALHESEERLRLLGDNLPDSAVYQYVHEADGRVRFQYFSAGVERLNGVTVQSVLQDADVLHSQMSTEYFAQLVEAEARSARDLSDFDMEIPMRRPDGEVRWMRLHSRPRRMPDGLVVWDGVQTDITEHKHAEESLREQEALLHETGRMAKIGGWEFDPATGQGNWTEQVAHIHDLDPSLSASVALGMTFYTGTSQTLIETALREAVEQAKPYDLELEFVSAKGVHKWVRTTGHPVVDGGKVVKMRGTLQDISERKQAECVLQTTLQRFYLILSNMYSGVLLVTDEGRIEFANQAFCDRFGLDESPAKLTGLDQGEMLNKLRRAYQYPDKALARIREVVGRGEPVAGEELAMQNKRTFLRDFVPLMVDGKSYGRLWLHTDITARKQAEERLRASETKYRDLSESIPTLLWATDAQGVTTHHNRRWHEYTGQSLEQGTGDGWKEIVYPGDLERVAKQWAHCIRTGEDYSIAYRIRRASDGSYRWHSVQATLSKDEQGNPLGWFGTLLDIHDQKQAEERLRLSEEKLSKAFATNPAAIVITRLADGVFLDANDAFAEMFGYSREEVIGASAARFWPTLGDRTRRVQELLQNGFYRSQEQIMLRRSGEPFAVLGSAALLNVAGEQLIISNWLDISERKKAESRLTRFYETDLFAILYWTIDGGVINVNNKFLEMTGYTLDDLQAGRLNWAQMTPPEYHAMDEDARRQIRETGVHLPYEKEFIRKDGTRVWGLFSAAAWEDNRNEGVSFILDVTKRKRAEEALRESEERWATTLQSIGDAVISTDATGNVQFMNDVAQRLTGWSISDAKGLDLSVVFNIVNEATRIKPESPVAKVLRSGDVVGLANHTALIQRDGTELPIEDSAAPIKNRSGQIEGVVLVFHDVLEQRNTEKALRISDRLATTGRLAATIAHEIHNPLDAIANLLYIIDNDTKEDNTRQFASMATIELGRVTQMTRRMLAFQRESAKPVVVDIKEMLGTVIELYERKVAAENIQVEQRIEINGHIFARPGELRQMFANLFGNAVEALALRNAARSTDGNDPMPGRIILRAYASHDYTAGCPGVRIVVADNGPGIPGNVRAKIFEPFFTTKGESGTGLGLWIASDILQKYDGVMRVKTSTRLDRSGTCFSVFLPFQSSAAPESTDAASHLNAE
jgi:PAS domain S-box-containing protein